MRSACERLACANARCDCMPGSCYRVRCSVQGRAASHRDQGQRLRQGAQRAQHASHLSHRRTRHLPPLLHSQLPRLLLMLGGCTLLRPLQLRR